MLFSTNPAEYLPNLNFFFRFKYVNKFIIVDDIQYSKNSFMNRAKINTTRGSSWLTVPVRSKNQDKQILKDVKIINETNWCRKHWNTLYHNYQMAPYFEHYASVFSRIYNRKWNYLIDLNMEFIEKFKEILNINTGTILSSALNSSFRGSEKIVKMALQIQCDQYFVNISYKDHLDRPLFEQQGIELCYFNLNQKNNRQNWTDYDPCTSIVDLLFYKGPESYLII